MADVFDLALDTIFNDPNMGTDVVYIGPNASEQTTVRMIKSVVPLDLALSQAAARMLTVQFEVLVTDLTPVRGDRLIHGDLIWEIKSAVQKDESDKIWLLDVVVMPA